MPPYAHGREGATGQRQPRARCRRGPVAGAHRHDVGAHLPRGPCRRVHALVVRRRDASRAAPPCSQCWQGSVSRWPRAGLRPRGDARLRAARVGGCWPGLLSWSRSGGARPGRLAAAGDPGLLRRPCSHSRSVPRHRPAAARPAGRRRRPPAPVLSQLVRDHVTPTPIAEPGGRDVLKELFLTGTYPALTWTTYLFVGLAIGRADLRRRGFAVGLLVGQHCRRGCRQARRRRPCSVRLAASIANTGVPVG